MSKLIKEIKAHQTNEVYADLDPSDLISFTSHYDEVPVYSRVNYSHKYEIGVTLNTSVIVQRDRLQFAEDRVRKDIAQYVFGEYRPMLIEISRAAYNRDFDKVMQKVIEIEESMFGGE